jgi:hypothetical protein
MKYEGLMNGTGVGPMSGISGITCLNSSRWLSKNVSKT